MTNLPQLAEHIQQKLTLQYDISCSLTQGELVVRAGISSVDKILTFLKRDTLCRFNQLMDICAVDYPEQPKRFEIIYNLLSLELNQRIRVIVAAHENEFVPSASLIFRSAPWYEREIWDMYGIQFLNHSDLRRILTDYGFEGHPLRKDFPLWGFTEVTYDPDLQRVKYKPVHLDQEYRDFHFSSSSLHHVPQKKTISD